MSPPPLLGPSLKKIGWFCENVSISKGYFSIKCRMNSQIIPLLFLQRPDEHYGRHSQRSRICRPVKCGKWCRIKNQFQPFSSNPSERQICLLLLSHALHSPHTDSCQNAKSAFWCNSTSLQWVSGSVIDSFRLEIAIASPCFLIRNKTVVFHNIGNDNRLEVRGEPMLSKNLFKINIF